MLGVYRNCLIVFPKCSSYELKDIHVKMSMDEIYRRWLKRLSDINGLSLCGFAEDVLLRNAKVTKSLMYTTGDADFTFIQNNMVDYFGEDYIVSKEYNKTVDQELIASAVKKIKPPDRRKCFDALAYKTQRANTVHRRIREVCNGYLKNSPFTVYFNSKGNMFCNSMKEEQNIGSKSIYVEVDLNTGISQVYYCGINITEDELFTILGGLSDGN